MKKEMRRQVDCVGSQQLLQSDHWDYKKSETSQRIPEESTSVRRISDLHQNHSPLSSSFSSPPSPRTCSQETCRVHGEAHGRSFTMISWHDKWSRLIICLSLTAWQLIKALQGCIICSVPLFPCLKFSLCCKAPDDELSMTRQARWRCETGTNSHSWLSMHWCPYSQNKEREGGFSTIELWFHFAVQLHEQLMKKRTIKALEITFSVTGCIFWFGKDSSTIK